MTEIQIREGGRERFIRSMTKGFSNCPKELRQPDADDFGRVFDLILKKELN